MFIGEYKHTIDEKGRFVLPQEMRYGLVEEGKCEFVIGLGLGGCLAIYRKREYGADASAVQFTRYAPGLKGALEKIKREHVGEEDKKRYSSSIAPLFISDPFKKRVEGLLSTHPPIDERIKKLEMM